MSRKTGRKKKIPKRFAAGAFQGRALSELFRRNSCLDRSVCVLFACLSGWFQIIFALVGYLGILYVMFGSTRRLELRQNKNYGSDQRIRICQKNSGAFSSNPPAFCRRLEVDLRLINTFPGIAVFLRIIIGVYGMPKLLNRIIPALFHKQNASLGKALEYPLSSGFVILFESHHSFQKYWKNNHLNFIISRLIPTLKTPEYYLLLHNYLPRIASLHTAHG